MKYFRKTKESNLASIKFVCLSVLSDLGQHRRWNIFMRKFLEKGNTWMRFNFILIQKYHLHLRKLLDLGTCCLVVTYCLWGRGFEIRIPPLNIWKLTFFHSSYETGIVIRMACNFFNFVHVFAYKLPLIGGWEWLVSLPETQGHDQKKF